MAAGTKGTDNTIEEGRAKDGGIVPGHAYTILQVSAFSAASVFCSFRTRYRRIP